MQRKIISFLHDKINDWGIFHDIYIGKNPPYSFDDQNF